MTRLLLVVRLIIIGALKQCGFLAVSGSLEKSRATISFRLALPTGVSSILWLAFTMWFSVVFLARFRHAVSYCLAGSLSAYGLCGLNLFGSLPQDGFLPLAGSLGEGGFLHSNGSLRKEGFQICFGSLCFSGVLG